MIFIIVFTYAIVVFVKSKNNEKNEDAEMNDTCYGVMSIDRILIDPEKPRTIYAIGEEGAYASDDGGETWCNISDLDKVKSDYAVFIEKYYEQFFRFFLPIINPHNTDILYHLKYGKIYKSINGGNDWLVNNNVSGCSDLVMDPRNPDILYSYCTTGLSIGKSEETSEGIYKSIDGGGSWELVLSGAASTVYTGAEISWYRARMAALVIDPDDPKNIYAAILRQGVYRSTDGGRRWDNVFPRIHDINAFVNVFPVIHDINAFVIDPLHPDTLYIGFQITGLYKSSDRGLNWSSIFGILEDNSDRHPLESYRHPLELENEFVSIQSLAVDPQNSDVIYVGTGGSGVLKSIDGGKSWILLNKGLPCGRPIMF